MCEKPPCGVSWQQARSLGMLCVQSLSIVIGQLLDGSPLNASWRPKALDKRTLPLDLWVVFYNKEQSQMEVWGWSLIDRVLDWRACNPKSGP